MVQFIWEQGWYLDYKYWESPRTSDGHKLKNRNEQRQTKKAEQPHSLQFVRGRGKVKKKKNSCQSSWKKKQAEK